MRIAFTTQIFAGIVAAGGLESPCALVNAQIVDLHAAARDNGHGAVSIFHRHLCSSAIIVLPRVRCRGDGIGDAGSAAVGNQHFVAGFKNRNIGHQHIFSLGDGVGGGGHRAVFHATFHGDSFDGGGGAHGDGAAVGGAAGRGSAAVGGVMDGGAVGSASDGHVLRAGVSARGRSECGRGHIIRNSHFNCSQASVAGSTNCKDHRIGTARPRAISKTQGTIIIMVITTINICTNIGCNRYFRTTCSKC